MDKLCLRLDSPDRFYESPQEKTPPPPNPVPPAMGVTETIVQQLEEDRSISPDSPMDRSSPGWRDFITKQSPKRPPPQIGPLANNPLNRSAKKTLSVDSPAFTPATLSVPGKSSAISSQAVNAAPFTPRGLASGKQVPRSAS
jgi:PAB-dependent poly(A)-specific ribonuclease subunit 3